ncbi:MAG: cation-transporting P-type ATPase [Betaproteobacteria bacterium]|nr:cation-transporting P-type ATPase [Betaproteobacteria bacterium]
MKIHHLSVGEALESLRSPPGGLAPEEAARRLGEYGANRVEEVRREHLITRFAREFTHLFALVLWLAAALAFVAERYDPGEGMATLGFAIVGVIVINGAFSFWQEYRAEQALAALRRLLPHQVAALRAGEARQVFAEALVPGDVVLLKEGDSVPADCRLLESFGLRVNNATITGESLPKARVTDPCAEEEIIHARNVLLAGTSLVSGEAKALVFATGMHTEFGKMAHLTQTSGEPMSPLQREIARLSRLVALLATILGLVFFLVGQVLGLSFWQNFIFAIGIIVANVPEGLLPTVTLSLAMATQRMARRNALIRHLPAVETLGSATVICTDKTGTLTQNRMSVKQLFFAEGFADELPAGRPAAAHHRLFAQIARHCHSLTPLFGNGWSGDPMEMALNRLGESALPGAASYPKADEVAFDADRKRMSTVHRTDEGALLYCKGALETVLPLCNRLETASGAQPLDGRIRERFLKAQEAMADRGLRILAFAYRVLPEGSAREAWEGELVLTGLAGLEDPPRPEVPAAIARCREAGIRVIMVTGDHPHTAKAIAREIGLTQGENPAIVTGDDLRRMSNTQLQLALDTPEILFARVGADQKMRIVNALKRKKEVVAATGDGVNDAPALKSAHIGIAMGISGTDVAKESSDMILLDDNFATIVAAIEEGRAVFDNIRKFLTYILTSNIPEIVPYLAFVLFRIPLPLTIVQILAVDLGTDMLPALALGAEKPDPAVMRRPPRHRSERLLNWPLVARAYLFLGMLEAVAAMAAFFFVLEGAQWHYGQILAARDPVYLQATTACLAAIIATQVVNVFLCRHPVESVRVRGLAGNRLILFGIAVELALLLLIVYTPWGNLLFGTAPLSLEVWLFILPFPFLMLACEEARKALVRRAASRATAL